MEPPVATSSVTTLLRLPVNDPSVLSLEPTPMVTPPDWELSNPPLP